MKKIMILLLTLILIFSFSSCNEEKSAPAEIEGCEVSLITGVDGIERGTLAEETWKYVEKYANENQLGSEYFVTQEAKRSVYLDTINSAIDQGAKLIVLAGSQFEITVYEAQKKYPDIYFLLIDGVPHSEKNTYDIKSKTVGVKFAEEEAGFLAGYAAVKDGYTKLSFLGTNDDPEIKRYGYGFAQGAAEAAEEDQIKVEMKYDYTNVSNASDKVKEKAEKSYENGTQVIFVCGGTIIDSVAEAAEATNGKIIGSDVDKSYLSDSVITTAEKSVESAVEDMIDGYADDKFIGGTAFNYAAKNNGICLELENAKFSKFTKGDYDSIFVKLKEGKIKLKKDSQVKSVEQFKSDWLSFKD